ncbi:hypothetical protein RB195_002204 [Necator americanus]|uniref:Uncharacterized protein n=1 Tax=Necator americanus TaxID=51031 RepID=A0ABR1DIX9_NECAM
MFFETLVLRATVDRRHLAVFYRPQKLRHLGNRTPSKDTVRCEFSSSLISSSQAVNYNTFDWFVLIEMIRWN